MQRKSKKKKKKDEVMRFSVRVVKNIMKMCQAKKKVINK